MSPKGVPLRKDTHVFDCFCTKGQKPGLFALNNIVWVFDTGKNPFLPYLSPWVYVLIELQSWRVKPARARESQTPKP